MDDLKEIGFYTLSNDRAWKSSNETPLMRCEIVLTDRCNFKCPYCRGLRDDLKGDIAFEDAKKVVEIWLSEGLKNVRFSGGEPTLWKGLDELVRMCKEGGVEYIAVSSNGSASKEKYQTLIDAGVNDFSISLDGGCCSIGDKMAGDIPGMWDKVVESIRFLSEQVYVSVGMVFTEDNVNDCVESVLYADSLGVSDIRVIPSAQFNEALSRLAALPEDVLAKYPILQYRIRNIKNGRHVRGSEKPLTKCWLALDDMAVVDGKHFPCIIHMREQGDPIGPVTDNIREDRVNWIKNHNPNEDPICKANCLDVCIDYCRTADKTHSFVDGELVIA